MHTKARKKTLKLLENTSHFKKKARGEAEGVGARSQTGEVEKESAKGLSPVRGRKEALQEFGHNNRTMHHAKERA